MLTVEELKQELRRREGPLASCFDKQRAAILNESRRKAVRTPRRAGKTTTCMIDAFVDAQSHPGAAYCYIALTRPSAEDIAWPIAKQIDREYGYNAHFQEAKLRVSWRNDASMSLYGADQKDWIHRLRGRRFRRIYVDEAAFYRVDLEKLLFEVLEPALTDLDGTLWLISTPGEICTGLFYDLWDKEEKGKSWSLITWSTLDNPYVADQYKARIKNLKESNPEIEKTPGFRREYLGEFVEDDKGLVYELGSVISEYELNEENLAKHSFVLGMDFGYKRDKTAFTVACYSKDHPNYVILESHAHYRMLLPDIASEIERYQYLYPGIVAVGDPASAQLIDELRSRFQISIYDAEKTDKFNWIRIYNSDVATGRVKIVGPSSETLIEEHRKLQRLQRPNSSMWKEAPGQPNDASDANLYAYRYCYHHRYRQPEVEPEPGSPEAEEKRMDDYWDEMIDRVGSGSSGRLIDVY